MRKLIVYTFLSLSDFLSVTHTEDLDAYLRNLAELIPNIPEPAKIEKLFPKIKSIYYKKNTTTEDGMIDVSVTFLIFLSFISQKGCITCNR
jgi:hypothetical protein